MFRYLRFYATPIMTPLLGGLMFLGGYFIWLPWVLYTAAIAIADQIVKKDSDDTPYKYPFFLDLALYMSLPTSALIFFITFWICGTGTMDAFGVGAYIQAQTGFDVIALRNSTAWYHYIALIPSLGFTITGVAGLAGHELTHRTWRPFDLWLGRIAMAFNWGIAFPIEHVYGHHAYVATMKDPATAARGDTLYDHIPKSMYRTVVNAWEIERNRLNKLDRSFFSYKNVLLRMAMVSMATTVLAIYMGGWKALVVYLALCATTKIVLEALNYVEHYGMIRVPVEPVQPHHSWNGNHLVSSVFTFNLTRHSHHHANAQVPFEKLKAMPEQPEMPGGFTAGILTTFIPPLWRKAIVPKLIEWDLKYATEDEKVMARQANEKSGWDELMHHMS